MKRIKKFKPHSFFGLHGLIVVALIFAVVGTAMLWRLKAATGVCSTVGVLGSSSYTVTVPETAQYKVWVRMQVPDTNNANNTNGVRLQVDAKECFTITSTSANMVNQWQWVNTSATPPVTPIVTTSLSAGSHNIVIYGAKAGVKVDKVLLLKSNNTCAPSNDFSAGQPGDNCTVDPPTLNFTATSTTVSSGGSSTLQWNATDATSCTASGAWNGPRGTSGSEATPSLTATSTYTLKCSGIGGSVSGSVTVTVASLPSDTTPPVISMSIDGLPSVVDGARVPNLKKIIWRPTATDASGIKKMVLTVNDSPVTMTGPLVNVAFNGRNATPNGNYVLKAVVTDNANNQATSSLTVKLRHPDINRDNEVNIIDQILLFKKWGMEDPEYDLDARGKVDIVDLIFLNDQWNSTE